MDSYEDSPERAEGNEVNNQVWPDEARLPDQVRVHQRPRNMFRPGHQSAEEKKRLFGPIEIDGKQHLL